MSFLQRFFSSKPSSPSVPPEQSQLPSTPDPSPPHNSIATSPKINSTHLAPPLQPPQPPSSSPSPSFSLSPSPRRKQLSFLLTGVAFVGLSALVTRRSITRRRISLIPRFYHQSNDPPPPTAPIGAMEALEAFNIATVNVVSHTIFWVGGFVWAFDIRGMDDLRARFKKAMGLEGINLEEKEEEFNEWVAEVFARKGEKKETTERDGRREEDQRTRGDGGR